MALMELAVRPLIETSIGAFCHMIEIGGAKIVLDCGLSDDFDYSIYDGCAQDIRDADCILVTSFGIQHIGALGMFPDRPAYCTVPTTVLGQIVLRDCAEKYKSFYGRVVRSEINPIQVKFSQPFKVNDVEICAFSAGSCVGNSVFRISFGLQSILVGYDLNQRRINYLDGLSVGALQGASVLVTNSAYAQVPPYTIRNRDELLRREIQSCRGKVFIAVRFTGLIELLSIIAKEKIIVVSRHGRLFVDRLKSMVEWAGTRANDIFAELNVDFGKIEDIRGHDIVIIVAESLYASYFGSILDRYNSPENLLLVMDREMERLRFGSLPVCSFHYSVKKAEALGDGMADKADKESGEEDENAHWSKFKSALFVGCLDKKSLFPHVPRRVYTSDYGETFKFTAEKKPEAPIKENLDDEVEEIETVDTLREGMVPLFQAKTFHMYGICDFKSSRAVIDSLGLQHLIIVNDHEENSRFYHASFGGQSNGVAAYLGNSEVRISFSNVVHQTTFSDEMLCLKYRAIGDKRVSKFLAQRSEDNIDVAGDYDAITIGSVNLLKLRKALLEKGFSVAVAGNSLAVNDRCSVMIDSSGLSISATDDVLLMGVRDVIYDFIAII